ncbi:MAG: mannitol-1-phosphate 5-dehydrogenase [bacterium]|nr:mannitol-1-phosphate 5-dehydrogenase [bacterium]MDE0287254.1 mannitol-1-phosphate 5-dehydrogenase [bacterium]MDE0437591.1 mannitol-1-phosphate 5-dehydrogenase [bacterium]
MTGRRVVVFGAGNIGRGLLGWLFGRAGWEVVFVDVAPALVELLNRRRSYRVIVVGDAGRSSELIEGVSGVDGTDTERATAATASAELVCTAVGAGILGRVAPTIAAALRRSDSRVRNVLACENADPNTALLKQHVETRMGGAPGVGFPETLVDRMVPGSASDDLSVEVEARFEFKVAGDAWIGLHPGVAGLELVDDLDLHRTRKLWLVNGLHAASAFLGLQSGHETIAQAVSDPRIRSRLEEMLVTMAAVLASRSGEWSAGDLADYGRSNLERFANTALVDPVRRVARNPLIKLGPGERLVGPAREAARRGLPVGALCDAIAAGLTLSDNRVDGVDDLVLALDAGGWQSVLGPDLDGDLTEMLRSRMVCPAP